MSYKNILLLLLFISYFISINGCSKNNKEKELEFNKKPIPTYSILKREDFSYSDIKRIQLRIKLNDDVDKYNFYKICYDIIKEEKSKNPVNAISFLFYKNDTEIDGPYTAAKAIWAPNGKWEDAGIVKTGDYSKNKLHLVIGSALGEYKSNNKIDIPLDKRKAIFYELVKLQDNGVGDSKAYDIISQKYNLDIKIVREIAVEGVMKNWPLP